MTSLAGHHSSLGSAPTGMWLVGRVADLGTREAWPQGQQPDRAAADEGQRVDVGLPFDEPPMKQTAGAQWLANGCRVPITAPALTRVPTSTSACTGS